MTPQEAAEISRYLRAQGYSTRTTKRASDEHAITAATRREGDMLRAVVYPLNGGAYCIKAVTPTFHSKLGKMLPVVVDQRHLSGTFAEPGRVADALL